MTQPTPDDVAPVTPPAPGQTDEWKSKYHGLDGAFKQFREKSVADLEAAKQVAKQFEEQLSDSKKAHEAISTKVKELEPFQSKFSEAETARSNAEKLTAKLKTMTKYPSLLLAQGDDGSNPFLALVESSNLEGEQLEGYLKQMADQLGKGKVSDQGGATPPTPPKGAEVTAAQLQAKANELLQAGKLDEWEVVMREYHAALDKENKFIPPTIKAA